ncbi:hypothetical protein [Conchiformibius steedae]|uniref:hypothetical protein n=1 Tax=Conchiformibius steedae TaxID=153493 RepID=UPI0026F31B9C|nr:hypothetical protein [Conchiformibius steedae]
MGRYLGYDDAQILTAQLMGGVLPRVSTGDAEMRKSKKLMPNWFRNIYIAGVVVLLLVSFNYPDLRWVVVALIPVWFAAVSALAASQSKQGDFKQFALYLGRVGGITVAVVLGIKLFFGLLSGDINWGGGQSEQARVDKAAAMCQDAVKQSLKSPSQADFNGVRVLKTDDGYTVSGTVEAPNSFGVRLSKPFKCRARAVGDGLSVTADL